MKQQQWIIVVTGALLMNTLFWQETFGVNLIVALLFILGSNFKATTALIKTKVGMTVIALTALSITMVVIHHSTVSVIAAITSLVVLIGFLHFPKLRTIYSGLLSGIVDSIKIPEVFLQKEGSVETKKSTNKLRMIRLILIPFLIFSVFVAIFYGANLFFRSAIDEICWNIANLFSFFFERFSFARILFFILCFFVSSWIVFKGVQPLFENYDLAQRDTLFRKKRQPWNQGAMSAGKRPQFGEIKTLGLKNENLSALMMIVAICCLLLLINCIDIVTVWFGYADTTSINYSEEVHEGVNYLITSILLSIAIILYVFRGNQNFYKNKTRLIRWSNFWILQNGILIVSVIIRNYYYISNQGLTHKRIGVFIFLLIVLIGLISLYLKINKSMSFYFMSKFNSWSMYTVLIAMTCVNWDLYIVRYNVQHRSSIEMDPYYLCSLSDETVLYLWNSKTELKQWQTKSHFNKDIVTPILQRRIAKIQYFQSDSKNQTFWSWNYRSHWMKQELKGIPYFEYDIYMEPIREFEY